MFKKKAKVVESTLLMAVRQVLTLIMQEGWVSRDFLRTNYGGELFDKVEKMLENHTSITKITRGDPPRAGYSWSDKKKLTTNVIDEFLKESGLALEPSTREKPWKDYASISFKIKFITSCLAGSRDPNDPGSQVLKFDRSDSGQVILRSGHFRGMMSKAIEAYGNGIPKYAKDKIYFTNVCLDEKLLASRQKECKGPEGRGYTRHEYLPEGTVVPCEAIIPQSRIMTAQFLELISVAGKYIGFSPAKSNQGWGRFEIVE